MKIKRILWWALAALCVAWAGCEQMAGGVAAAPPANPDGEEIIDPNSFGEAVYEPQITAVAITRYPDTTFFAKGEDFSYDGLELKFIYDNGEYGRTLNSAEYRVEAVDTTKEAPSEGSKPKQVTVTVLSTPEGDFPAVKYGIRIDSSTSILKNITMTKGPSKLSYTLGQDFETGGVEVEGTYSGGDRNGETVTVTGAVTAAGYDKYRRGTQQVTLKLNGKELANVDVTVKVPAGATMTINWPTFGTGTPQTEYLKIIQIRGRPYNAAYSNIRATVKAGGQTFILNAGTRITDADLSGYDPAVSGLQTVTLNLDGNTKRFDVYTVDAGPEVWFDYGYRRTAADPNGAGPGAGVYYAQPDETLVLSPVRFLIGYNDEHKDTGASYTWSVISGPSSYTLTTSSAPSREFCYFKPSATGTYRVKVAVSGRDYVTGTTVTRYAETDVVCYTGIVAKPADKTYNLPMKHFAPGQHTQGAGNGWSLGSGLGYEVWRLPKGANPLNIHGNPFSGWSEAGIVWVQYDSNGNGIPDEMWYELRGSEDDDAGHRQQINRRFAIRYIRYPTPAYFRWNGEYWVYDRSLDTEDLYAEHSISTSSFAYVMTPVCWADAKGRVGQMGGWPCGEGMPDTDNTYAVYSGTLLRDSGGTVDRGYNLVHNGGYVDTGGTDKYPYATFNAARDARKADGADANLTPALVRFVKVQTALLQYGAVFGNVDTEIVYGTNLPDQSGGFPMPEGGYEPY